MGRELDNYLLAVEKYLRSMPVSERIDVVKELKSYIEELLNKDNKTPLEIINQLGSPKELAKGYLSDVISKNSTYSLRKFMMIISFYGLTGLSGMFLLPLLKYIVFPAQSTSHSYPGLCSIWLTSSHLLIKSE